MAQALGGLVLPFLGRKANKGPPYALYKSAASGRDLVYSFGRDWDFVATTSDLVLVGVLVVLTIATVWDEKRAVSLGWRDRTGNNLPMMPFV